MKTKEEIPPSPPFSPGYTVHSLYSIAVVPMFLTLPSYFSHEIQAQQDEKKCLTYYSVEVSAERSGDLNITCTLYYITMSGCQADNIKITD